MCSPGRSPALSDRVLYCNIKHRCPRRIRSCSDGMVAAFGCTEVHDRRPRARDPAQRAGGPRCPGRASSTGKYLSMPWRWSPMIDGCTALSFGTSCRESNTPCSFGPLALALAALAARRPLARRAARPGCPRRLARFVLLVLGLATRRVACLHEIWEDRDKLTDTKQPTLVFVVLKITN